MSVIKGNQMIKNDTVKMTEVELWSDKDTWGGEAVPQKGEEIIIESGKNILIDQDIDVDTIHNFGRL